MKSLISRDPMRDLKTLCSIYTGGRQTKLWAKMQPGMAQMFQWTVECKDSIEVLKWECNVHCISLMHRKCIPQTKLESKIKQTTVYHSAQVGLWITDKTVAERMHPGGRMLGCKPRVHYPSTLPLLSFLVHPPSSFLLWSSLIFPLFAPTNSFRHSHLIWGRKCGFFFFSGFSVFAVRITIDYPT